MLQISEFAALNASWRKRRLRRVRFDERLRGERGLAACAFDAENAQLVDALVEQRVDSSVAQARRAAESSGPAIMSTSSMRAPDGLLARIE